MNQSIAIAHKDYDVRGGGEILAEELARTFDAPMYVGHGAADAPADVDVREIAPSSRYHRLMDMGGAPRGVGHMLHWRDNAYAALAEYDTVVTSGNEPLWWVPGDSQTVVAYTHSPPRWMYDRYSESRGFVGRTYQQLQRRLYEGTVKRPDVFVANSELVARRIERYWNIPRSQIRTVYPPVETETLSPDAAETGEYYLALSRLDPMKHFDEIVRAFRGRDTRLVVAGDGPERDRLEAMAGDNVEFAGYVSEERKRELLAGARAFVYAAENEDFGMAPIEAMAAGTPVIGVREGFTRFQILEGQNGTLFDRGELPAALDRFEREGVAWSDSELAEFADDNFSVDRFHRQMRQVVADAQADTAVAPEWVLPGDETAERDDLVADGGDA